MSDGRELPARLIGRDAGTDLAVIKVEGNDFKYVSFEETAEPRVGDWVIAVGNPFGLGGTATAGIVSAKARDIDPTGYNDYIQIDAAINRGNSGGPLLDSQGRLIGINTSILSGGAGGGNDGIAFAVPTRILQTVTEQLRATGKVRRGTVGAIFGSLTPQRARELDLGIVRGTLRHWLEVYGTGKKTAADGTLTSSPLQSKPSPTSPTGPAGETPEQKIARLEARVNELEVETTKLTTEREILQRAAKYFAGETRW